ncbi:hypothetical protein ACP4OV_017089 [Aristida adscensionis]
MEEEAAAAAVAVLTGQWTAPALEEVLPELSREEQLRVQARFRERDAYLKRQGHPHNKSVTL